MEQAEEALAELEQAMEDVLGYPTVIPGVIEDYIAACGDEHAAPQVTPFGGIGLRRQRPLRRVRQARGFTRW